MQVSAQNAQIQLSDQLPTKIHVGNYLETHAQGAVNTELNIDKTLILPLQGIVSDNFHFIRSLAILLICLIIILILSYKVKVTNKR